MSGSMNRSGSAAMAEPDRSRMAPFYRAGSRRPPHSDPLKVADVKSAASDSERGMRILLVEDDPMIGKTLQQALTQDGYAVDRVTDGEAGKAAVAAAQDAYAMV